MMPSSPRTMAPLALVLAGLVYAPQALAVNVANASAAQSAIDGASSGSSLTLTLTGDLNLNTLSGGDKTLFIRGDIDVLLETDGNARDIDGVSGHVPLVVEAGSTLTITDVTFTDADDNGCIRVEGNVSTPGPHLTLTGTDLTGCATNNGDAGDEHGGAVRAIGAEVVATNVTIDSGSTTVGGSGSGASQGLHAQKGGIFYLDATSALTVTGGSFDNALANQGGFAFSEGGPITISGATITGTESDGRGGAIFTRGELTLVDVQFIDTVAGNDGGAIAFADQGAGDYAHVLTDVVFEGTTSGDNGGAVFAELDAPDSLTFSGATQFIDTEATESAGGLYVQNGDLFAEDISFYGSAVTGTNAANLGGAMWITGSDCTATLTRAVFVDTSAPAGGAIAVEDDADLVLTNGLFERNAISTGGNSNNGAALLVRTNGDATVSYATFTGSTGGATIRSQSSGSFLTLNQVVIDDVSTPAASRIGPNPITFTDVLLTSDALLPFGSSTTAGTFTAAGGTLGDPAFAGALGDNDGGSVASSDLWLGAGSVARNAATNGAVDPDGSVADLGALGGPDATAPGGTVVGTDPLWDAWTINGDGDADVLAADCNDGNANVGVSGTEVVGDNVDQDCDGFRLCFADTDGDGQGDSGGATANAPAGAFCGATGVGVSTNDDDCDDTDPDEFLGQTWYLDGDNDDFGTGNPTTQCTRPGNNYGPADGDCDDTNGDAYPGAPETPANGVDEDCDGKEDCYADTDGDTYGDPNSLVQRGNLDCDAAVSASANNTDCDDTNADYNPDANWRLDGDSDGFGAGAPVNCEPPQASGWVSETQIDCDDGLGSVNPGENEVPVNGIDNDCDGNETCYADTDGDGFGDSSNEVESSDLTCATGPIANNSNDCNDADSDRYIGAPTWPDSDGDGFGNSAASSTPVNPVTCDPNGTRVLNNDDCLDTDGDVFPGATYFTDSDGDGFGTTPTQTPGTCGLPSGFATQSGDCNDNDPLVFPNATYYLDDDGDSFGDPNVTTTACVPPANYVTNNTDCDDTDGLIFPGATYYGDGDDDGFGLVSNPITPGACGLPNGYATNDDDCVDNNDFVYPDAPYWPDADGDGFGDSSANSIPRSGCFATAPAGGAYDNTDCEDGDGLIFPGATYYNDPDGDGYGVAASTPSTCGLPPGTATLNGDCAPSNDGIFPGATYWDDTDGDGYGDSSASSTPGTCGRPVGTVVSVGSNALPADCDDTEALNFPGTTTYADTDGDGQGDDSTGQVRPTCSLVNAALAGGEVLTDTDCDDADANIFLGATYWLDNDGDGQGTSTSPFQNNNVCVVPNNHVTNDLDCNDSNGAVFDGATYYEDTDQDGFGDASSPTTPASCGVVAGYVTNDEDCDDTDALSKPGALTYLDADGDGFGRSSGALTEPTCADLAAALSSGRSLLNTDCDDVSANDTPGDVAADIFPGATYYADTDADGYGDSASPNTPVTCGRPANASTNDTDCDDTDGLIFPGATYYQDSDNDGFGSAAFPDTTGICTLDPGQSTNDDDCNDAEALIFPGGTYYADTDGDGFGDPTAGTSNPSVCVVPNGRVIDNTDCVDTNGNIFPGAIYGEDDDGDGFGTPNNTVTATVGACPPPAGFADNTDDCDDDDSDDTVGNVAALIRPGAIYYADTDGDGYGDPFSPDASGDCVLEANQSTDDTDCDDTDGGVYPDAPYWLDSDGDGQGTNPVTTAPGACGRPTVSGGTAVSNDDDCDDANALIFLGADFWTDADGDTFGEEGSPSLASPSICPNAAGQSTNDADCDDSTSGVNPDRPEIVGNGVDEDCSGLPQCFSDSDGDGFGLSTVLAAAVDDNGDNICNGPGEANNNDDCDDTSNVAYPGAPETCGDGIDSDCSCTYTATLAVSESGISTLANMAGCGFANGDEDGDGFTFVQERDDNDFNGDGFGTSDCDLDSDDDDLDDAFEVANNLYPDAADDDGDGLNDGVEIAYSLLLDTTDGQPFDADNDGILDPLDDDDDNDGVTTFFEGELDVDCADPDNFDYTEVGDGIPNHLDLDSDGDGIPDLDEGSGDADGDGKQDFIDCSPDGGNGDSDCDGIFNAVEVALGLMDGNADSDGDGVPDGTEIGDPTNPVDSDGDGTPDVFDTDDDGDGVPTLDELLTFCDDGSAATPQSLGAACSQTFNYGDFGLTWTCADGSNPLGGNADAPTGGPYPLSSDLVPNYLDTDDDGDGTPTLEEGTGDLDGDDTADFLDVDDADGPLGDRDGDGLVNAIETPAADGGAGTDPMRPDTDGDGLLDGDELFDMNGDGILSADERLDSDSDGQLDALDDDDDGDSLLTLDEGLADPDGDGIPAYLDDDSDGDGLSDSEEAPATRDVDGDGIPDFLDANDTDGPDANGRLEPVTTTLEPEDISCGGCNGSTPTAPFFALLLGALAVRRRRKAA